MKLVVMLAVLLLALGYVVPGRGGRSFTSMGLLVAVACWPLAAMRDSTR